MPRVEQAYIVANPENIVQEEKNAVCKGRCWLTTFHSISMELNMSIGTVHTIVCGL